MSEEMINLESYDTLGVKMADPIQVKLNKCPQPPFFMDPKKALPFWLVRSLGDKMPMVSIPEKLNTPYTRGMVGENIVASLDPNKFITLDPEAIAIEYKPLHDKHLKKFFKSPMVLRNVEKTGEVVDGQTVCSLKEYNEYRKFIHRLQLNYVSEQNREEEELKVKQNEVETFMKLSKKDCKEKWNKRFNEYLKTKNQQTIAQCELEKTQKCLKRIKRVEVGRARVQGERLLTHELRVQKWVDYKKRMDSYFKNKREAQQREAILAKKRWVVEATVNKHRKSLVQNENKLKRELKMEENWNRRMAGQILKLQKEELVRDQYNASIQLMRQRREKYYDCKDVEIDELLSLPGMNSLEELEIFNTQVDQFSPEFVSVLHGSKFHINRSGKSLTLDKSLRKYIVHHESAAERMKKANVARPIKYALDVLVRRSVGYYAMVVTHNTIQSASELALKLASKIRSSPRLRQLITEEYRQFGPRSAIPFLTLKKFDDIGLDHCICDYTEVDKAILDWPCPLCRKEKISPVESDWSSSISSRVSKQEPEELYVIGEGKTIVGFLVPPKKQKMTETELIIEEQKLDLEPLFVEAHHGTSLALAMHQPSEQVVELLKEDKLIKRKQSNTSHKGDKNKNKLSQGSKLPKRSSISKIDNVVKKTSKTSTPSKSSASSKKSRSKLSAKSLSPKAAAESSIPKQGKKGKTSALYKRSPRSRKSVRSLSSKSQKGVRTTPSKQSENQLKRTEMRKSVSKLQKKSKKAVKSNRKTSRTSKGSKTSSAPIPELRNQRSQSILRTKPDRVKASQKGPSKGVSFAVEAKHSRPAKTHRGGNKAPIIETVPLVQSANLQVCSRQNAQLGACSSNPVLNNIEQEASSGRSKDPSIVSLLSITSDDRMCFVKGQCLFDKQRGSKLGKLKTIPQASSKVKKGFIKGTCRCKTERGFVDNSNTENITKRATAEESVIPNKKKMNASRWRAIVEDSPPKEVSLNDISWPRDLSGILEKLSDRKQMKLKYLIGAKDLFVKCLCEKCYKDKKIPATGQYNAVDENIEKLDMGEEAAEDMPHHCRCRKFHNSLSAINTDLLAHITKVIGKKRKHTQYDEVSQYMKDSSHKLSIRTMVEKQKSIISKLIERHTSETVLPAALRKEPVVHKYYIDEQGNLYILNRKGEKTIMSTESKNFMIDENGRKFFHSDSGKKYFVDVTGRVYLENEEGDVFSLFYEDGCEYINPQPRKLLLHELVRESVLDLVHSPGQDDVASNEDFVEMIYEYLFEGGDNGILAQPANDASRSDREETLCEDEASGETAGVFKTSKVIVPKQSDYQATRMPIKRPLKLLINEVPFNRDISRLFIQRKKYHDCCAIVFRRCLLYSLAKFTQITETGFDPLGDIDDKKRITGLDCLVKGLTKITAHYPLKLVKSKRLAPFVDALVHGFIGTQGYNIFPSQNVNEEGQSVSNMKGDSGAWHSREVEYDLRNENDSKLHISHVEGLDSMKHYCCLETDD